MVQSLSLLCLLHSSTVLTNQYKIIMIYHYFYKFDTSILITMNYHMVIPLVDADTQTANKDKISKRSWYNNLTIHNNLHQVFVCGNPLDPTNFLPVRLPLIVCILDNSNFAYELSLSNSTKEGWLLTSPYGKLILYLTKVFLGLYWNSPLDRQQ